MAVINGLIAAILLFAAIALRNKFLPYQGLFGFNFAAGLLIGVKLFWAAITGLLFSLFYFYLPNNAGKLSTAAVVFALLFISIDLWIFAASAFDSSSSDFKSDLFSNSVDLIITGLVFTVVYLSAKFIKAKFFSNI
ncbi:MAG: hypothetical protein ACR2L1_09450 [Pyrinomonadaceae bacterium]